jgi:hypothetical protein
MRLSDLHRWISICDAACQARSRSVRRDCVYMARHLQLASQRSVDIACVYVGAARAHTRNTRRLAGWRWPGAWYLVSISTCSMLQAHVRNRPCRRVRACIRTWMAWALGRRRPRRRRRRHRHLARARGSDTAARAPAGLTFTLRARAYTWQLARTRGATRQRRHRARARAGRTDGRWRAVRGGRERGR